MIQLPDLATVPYNTYTTPLSRYLSFAVALVAAIFSFFSVILPWLNEREISSTKKLLIEASNLEPYDISEHIESFSAFINPSMKLARIGNFSRLRINGMKCEKRDLSFNRTTFRGFNAAFVADSDEYFSLSNCDINCNGETWHVLPDEIRPSEAGNCILGPDSWYAKMSGNGYAVFGIS